MPPTIHCVRHAQGVHNLCTANHVIPDPLLTDLGHEQCAKLREVFPYHDKIDLVTASPLRRTIYTALESFGPVFKSHPELNLIALPDTQETSDVPCDTGSEPAELQKEFAGKNVDLNLVHEGWNNKAGRYAPTNAALRERARAARHWLKSRPEKEIVLVTHGGFLHYLTEDWEDHSQYQGTGWSNTEFRSYTFSQEDHRDDLEGRALDGGNATLVETIESRERRGKPGPTPDREEQKKLYQLGTQSWNDQLNGVERDSVKVPEGEEVDGVRV
ncbi:phosphoglycerate mutase family protein [Penicillium verhagenii]|uniref:phosphoglycerate mutase family protein n=1 Tax=Penicillium verhagenii TaxID=1562060 RepID=UPI0025458C44|nr:phosphoglycerate mutase family protein [Penicillium verhagenii]KAJ5928985.1 phosphoglycerate mutase family protein [Penicillium verhagenii]